MDIGRLQQLLSQSRGGAGAPQQPDAPMPDTAEKIQISSLSLLKMLKHGRAGVPMEVMGLMLGNFVDEKHHHVHRCVRNAPGKPLFFLCSVLDIIPNAPTIPYHRSMELELV